MPSDEDDLRAVADSIAQDAGRLKALEETKKELEPEDPRAASLSEQVEELGAQIRVKATAQRELTEGG